MTIDSQSIDDAQRALAAGNHGRARVCSRRAVGEVARMIGPAVERDFGRDAMTILRAIEADVLFGDEIRAAAVRLLRGPRDLAAGEEISIDPVADAQRIIEALLRLPQQNAGGA